MSKIAWRHFDMDKDLDAVLRIFHEIGWIESGDKTQEEGEVIYIKGGEMIVADLNGEAETFVLTQQATLRYLEEDLALSIIAGVGTSRIARKSHTATQLTARALAHDVIERGAIVSTLGMFEQGFYNRLGFGTGSYIHVTSFDPADLMVEGITPRPPIRLGVDDFEQIHQARCGRLRTHGACTLQGDHTTQANLHWGGKGAFGLGYLDDVTGELGHHFWCVPKGEYGPYRIVWLNYQNRDEFLELLALIKALGDQVRVVRLAEPSGIQMWDFLRTPFRTRTITRKSEYQTGTDSVAWWQMRICDLPACLAKTKLRTSASLQFNLIIDDPVTKYLDDDLREQWPGTAGDYLITLGAESSAVRQDEPRADLLTLHTSINTFTRLWLGVQPASGLAFSEPDFNAAPELIADLDGILNLPVPQPDWDF